MKELWGNLKFAWKYTKDQKANLIKYVIATIVSIGINLVLPILSARIITELTTNLSIQLVVIALIIFIVENLFNITRYFTDIYMQRVYRETFTKIQTELGSCILKLENKVLDENGTGVFIQRLTNDTSRLADIFNVLNIYLSNFITNVGIFIAVFLINKVVFLYLVVSISIMFWIERTRTKKTIAIDKVYRKKSEKVTGFVGEIVRGARDIKMLNSESSFINALNKKILDTNKTRYEFTEVRANYVLLGGFASDTSYFLLIVLLFMLMINDYLSIPMALVVYNYSTRLDGFIYWFGQLIEKVKDFNLSASRVFEIINGKKFKKESFGTMHLDKVNGDFEFKNVAFAYGKNKVLNDVSFKINANETVAFVGKSGSGKTTIFNLLCKMYDIDKGEILIDGINIKKLDRESIRGNITIISQNPYIFNLSIKENLKLVKEDLTNKEMIEACKVACLHDFIMSLPKKYDTLIGEGGVNLSGGQKQRLAIARALVQKTEIILFDEATSALDNETQESIQKAIENMKNEYTILIIAHRLSTIINCDRILLLDSGKIVAEGTHQKLLKKSKIYKNLYESEIKE
ncbi:MAG: ABC transporter ATP-binding protein [Bacilli bacterium]|nr:ABC transporter ATP-binding protein [Bacilli bacterium]